MHLWKYSQKLKNCDFHEKLTIYQLQKIFISSSNSTLAEIWGTALDEKTNLWKKIFTNDEIFISLSL